VRETLFPLPQISKVDECLIYHDESKEVFGKNVWAHALFFVPESASARLLAQLWAARKRHWCEDKKLHFADISGDKISEEDGSIVIKEWLQYGIEALRSKGSACKPALSCKLGVIFFQTSLDLDLYGGGTEDEKMLRYFETVLRMLLKGCAHGLYDPNNRLKIKGIVTDGEPWHRELDKMRILDRLISEAREYVHIDGDAYIEGIVSDHSSPNCTDSNKAQFLQLTDLLLGSVIHCCFRGKKYRSKKEIIIRPVREMLEKRKWGAGFLRSGHYRSFSLSFAHIDKDQWKFEQVDTKEIIYEDNQLKLFGFNEGTE